MASMLSALAIVLLSLPSISLSLQNQLITKTLWFVCFLFFQFPVYYFPKKKKKFLVYYNICAGNTLFDVNLHINYY